MACLSEPAESAPEPPPSRCRGESPVSRLRVLLVDDDSRVLRGLRETIALEADLVVVGAAADAASALSIASASEPTVVLMDVLLPDDVTGLGLAATLSRRSGCVVVTMSVRSNLRRAALDAGAVAFVDKGDDIEAILQCVRVAGGRAS